jgi:hypothetical protein
MYQPNFLKTTLSMALVLAVAFVIPARPAQAATTWTLTSPDATVTASVTLSDTGTLSLAIAKGTATIISPSSLGVVTSTVDLTRGLSFTSRTDATVTENYTMATGKRKQRQNTFRQSTLAFTGANGTQLNVVARVANDGVAYRYVLPATGTIRLSREASAWTLPASAPAWLQPFTPDNQGKWFESTAGSAASNSYGYGALFNVNGTYALLSESDIGSRYPGSWLSHQNGSGTYTTALANAEVVSAGPLSTAWRIAAVGSLKTVTESTITDDLAPPSRVPDASWVRPGTVAWSWLTEPASPSSESRQRQYIDFAQRHNWPFVLIDEGWNSSWVPSVVQYGRDRGVGVILWFNSSALWTAQQRENWLPLVKSWGVAGVKVDYIWENNQATMSWYDAILTRTAELKLMVNFHGAEMLRGMQRTWPHVMTAEGIFGAEQKQNRAAFNTMLPYTRNAVSSMDFTPVTLSVTNRDTTDAHEVATAVVFESGWQHDADNPESYESHPDVVRTLDQLPAVWDETRLLGGTPRREAYLARRNADRWFIGGISALAAKTYQTPLSFLGTGQWFADILRDGTSGGVARETRVVASTDTLSVPMASNGGFVAIVCHYTAGMTQCPRTSGPSNVAFGKPANGSAACNANESPAKAFNGSVSGGNSDKFCSGAATKFLQVDLGQSYPITSFTVRHAGAGGENAGWNTRDFDILVSPDGTNWTTIIQARGNTANITTHTTTTTARYARLNILAAEQGTGGATRIYEFEVYS